MLDINSLEFHYGVLAAAAFCHFSSFEVVHKVSGKELIDIHFSLLAFSPNSFFPPLCQLKNCKGKSAVTIELTMFWYYALVAYVALEF